MNGDLLLQLMVAQTMQITLLAGAVCMLTRCFAKDRPHLAHALWALVLLKCLTPPVFASPTSAFSWLSSGYSAVVNKVQSPPTENELSRSVDQQGEGLAPVVVRFSPGNNTNVRTESVSASIGKADSVKVDAKSLVAISICIWVTIAAFVFAMNATRLWVFLRRVKRTTLPTSPSLRRLVERVSKRIGLRRKVRICTVDAAIGPAVVGLIWPTILLPKVIVEGKSDAELEPLLAHELIHIRRGDLAWAMLQGISVSLWWFNPSVWLAERLLTREAERSCDEETIAGLGCSPAVYARSLLDVMERKHQLRAAPSLPGVRPVDITAKRLERIMRLGHGSYRQRPWWVVGVWLIGCAIALPGAAWVVAQEKPKEDRSVFKEAGYNSAIYPNPISGKRPNADTPAVAQTQIETKSFEIADVIERLCKDRDLAKAEAEKELVRLIKPVAPVSLREFEDRITTAVKAAESIGPAPKSPNYDESSQPTEPSLEECIAIALENSRNRSAVDVKIVGERLQASATVEQVKQIERSIEHFRKFGFRSVITEVEFYEMPQSMTLDQNEFKTGNLVFVSSEDTTRESEVVPNMDTFDEAEVTKFKQRMEKEKDVVRLLNPTLTSFSGQTAAIQTGEGRNFTIAYKAVKAPDGTNNYQPVTQSIQTGIEFEIRAVIDEPTNADDDEQIELMIHCRRSNLESVTTSQQTFPDTDKEFVIECPVANTQFIETGCRLKPAQSLVTVQTFEKRTFITVVRCKPIATTVASTPAPAADLNQLDKTAYVSVSDELQSELEIALMKHKLQQLGIKDFQIDNGRLQVRITEDWKAAVNAFQELRSNRNSAEGSAKPTNPKAQEFKDGDTTYNPIQTYGPIVQGKWVERGVPVLSRFPYINRLFKSTVIGIDPTKQKTAPTDDEILHALAKQTGTAPGWKPRLREQSVNGSDSDRIKITATKVRGFKDPSRFVPLIGDAELHHAHYKCSLHDAETDELKSVAYIDYCQFWVAEKVDSNAAE